MVKESLLILLLASPAGAVFQRADMERVDHEVLLDTEYFLDFAGFALPLVWDEELRKSTADVSYRVNAASLDCCDLYIRQEARLRRRLTPATEFRWVFTQRGDKDKEETRHLIELERSLPGGFSAILFGEPAFNKEDADIGLGASWRGLQFRRNWVDFTFNKRSPGGESYSKVPITDQLYYGRGDFSAAAELDHPTRRNAFFYRRTTATAWWRPGPWAFGYVYEYQRKADGTATDNKRWAHYAKAAGRYKELEAGLSVVNRRSRTEGVRFYRRWELEPYARWRKELGARVESELATFLGLGRDRDDTIIESKLGAGFDFKFGPAGRIGVYATFDIDEADTHFWDGGNARAQIFF